MYCKEFMQKTATSFNKDIYFLPYRAKTISEYKNEIKKTNKEPEVYEEYVNYFKNLELDIPDGFKVNILFLGELNKNDELIYSISVTDEKEIKFNKLFSLHSNDDEYIDLIINSLCKAMSLKHYEQVVVQCLDILSKNAFEEYQKEYEEEMKRVV